MMGERQTDQPALFYEFSLERHVPSNHLLRSIDRFVDLSGIREHLRPYYSETGRPSIDPELMIRMLLIGYTHGIRSERRLCEEVHLNLAYRWFCRLGLGGAVPDHSKFSKNRHGRSRDSDLLCRLFEEKVARCIAEGLVGGEDFAVDASMIKADANRQRSVPGKDWEPPDDPGHAVREYLAVLHDAAFGGATPAVPKFISASDPASRWTGANGEHFLLKSCWRDPRHTCRISSNVAFLKRDAMMLVPPSASPTPWDDPAGVAPVFRAIVRKGSAAFAKAALSRFQR